MDNMELEFIKLIDALRALGYSYEEINFGIQSLDSRKYTEWDRALVLHDIIKNIEQDE